MGEKSDIHYVEERAKKITEALYRVTDLFPDREPLKWNLRAGAVEILEVILSLGSYPPKGTGDSLKNTEQRIQRLVALLDLAQAGSFISSLNFEVLKSEYRNLQGFLLVPSNEPSQNLLPVFYELQNMGIIEKQLSSGEEGDKAPPEALEKQMRERDRPQKRDEPIGQDNGQISRRYFPEKDRRSVIVDCLQRRPGQWVSVRELAALFEHNLSEKTLQRDLAGMIEEGIVDKQGDKRWRRYAMKNK